MKQVHFLLILEEVPPASNFSLKNLQAASKIDVVARVILALYPRFTKKIDATLDVLFTRDDSYLLKVKGIKDIESHIDEISIAADIRTLIGLENSKTDYENLINLQAEWLSIENLESYLKKSFSNFDGIFYLHETGEPIQEQFNQIKKSNSFIFILGGRQDISKKREEIILNLGGMKINIGKKPYLASSCLTKIIFLLEKLLT
jgi:tRNA pseudouridine-54 N-methylase